MHLSGVHSGLCRKTFVFPVRYHALLWIYGRSREFSIHLNWPLLDIISQSRAILCIHYVLELDFVGDSIIPFILSGPNSPLSGISLVILVRYVKYPCLHRVFHIALNRPWSDISYSYKSVIECPIVYIIRLWIGNLMTY